MSATRWLKLAAIAALVYVLYDFIPSPLPDMSGDVHQIVVAALIVALLLSGFSSIADRRAERDRERRLTEERTVVLQPVAVPAQKPVVGRVFVVMPHEPSLDGYDKGWIDGLAARPVRDGGRRVLPFEK
jgi:hypothetical protein